MIRLIRYLSADRLTRSHPVWPGASDDERRVWEEHQARIIDEAPLMLLERLAAAIAGQEPSLTTPTPPATSSTEYAAVSQAEQQPIDDEQRRHLESLHHDHRRRLMVLERQAAQLGALAYPHILTEIEDIQAKITAIDRQLGISPQTGSR